MSVLLQIETATASCSVALARDGEFLAVKEVNERNIHAEVITRFIEEVVKECGVALANLDAIAVSAGPGSYTGLRIGISTAKGLCFALDKPLIAVDTLTAMAYGALNSGKIVLTNDLFLCPMIDARRMEVYTAIFDIKLNQLKPTAAEIIDENSFNDLLNKHRILFFGDGAEKCREVLSHNPNALFLSDFVNSAAFITSLALGKFKARSFENVALFEPFYLKDFIAGKKKSE
jgi:tRNA threonylcarbamoyladenosine biosynthesis protein TsaB